MDRESLLTQKRERLRRGDFVYQMQVDVQHGGRVGCFGDNLVLFPNFLKQGFGCHNVVPKLRRRAECQKSGRPVVKYLDDDITVSDGR
jgi:hypothetical protein